eukprot:Gb_25156 [translate_table: standard]
MAWKLHEAIWDMGLNVIDETISVMELNITAEEVIFPEEHVMTRLFTSPLARRYEELYEENGVKFIKGAYIKGLVTGTDGRVAAVQLENGSTVDADTLLRNWDWIVVCPELP